MSRALRALLLVLAPLVLVVGGVAAPTAFAASTATVSGKVVDGGGLPIRGVQVWVTTGGDDYEYLGGTDELGQYSSPHGVTHQTGANNLVFIDSARRYASDFRPTTFVSGANAVADFVMKPGATVTGTIKAPSGALLKNVGVVLADNDSAIDPDYAQDYTTADGVYVAKPLGTGSFDVLLSLNGYSSSRRVVAIPDANQIDNQDVVTRVPVKLSFTATSPSRHRATLKVSVSAAQYGLAGPGGKVRVYDGTRIVRSGVTLSSTGKATISLSSLKSGRHTFKVSFLGATDTLPKSAVSHRITVN
jgi:type 1 fimbria pilin